MRDYRDRREQPEAAHVDGVKLLGLIIRQTRERHVLVFSHIAPPEAPTVTATLSRPSIDRSSSSIDDPAPALDEVARALVPGGVLRFYEHVGSAHRPLRLLERLVNLVWSRLAGGCHLDWDSVAAIRDAGFEITTLESFAFSGVTHVLGEARTPGAR